MGETTGVRESTVSERFAPDALLDAVCPGNIDPRKLCQKMSTFSRSHEYRCVQSLSLTTKATFFLLSSTNCLEMAKLHDKGT